jgi:cytochrome c oxidase accessory protein FixG
MDAGYSEEHETFRNELASVARDGRRKWIYARQPKGRLYRARTIVSVVLLAFLFLAPFLTVGGQPLMLLDILHRRFVLFGVVFRPQDFYIVVLLALTVLVTLVLSTVVAGRIWCGWLCPQTVFMEMVFRRLEYLLEGSAEQQVRLARGPWTRERLLRKGAKHAIFFALSFAIANVFLAWIIGADELWRIVTDPPRKHLVGLFSISLFSLVFYAVFARFREQACVLACPYGRVMSALIDKRTVTVTYDHRRGEPRGRLARALPDAAPVRGDCIDCHQCVTVCPTGIDIRDGIQLECVNCTACIDACNSVMDRIGKPAGLIRVTSHHAVTADTGRRFGARAAAYGVVWIALVSTVVFLLASRRSLDVLILRQAGTLYTTAASGEIANFYTLQAFNRTSRTTAFVVDVDEPAGATVTTLGRMSEVEPYGLLEGRLLLRLPPGALTGPSTPVRFVVRTPDGVVQTIPSAFLGPATAK